MINPIRERIYAKGCPEYQYTQENQLEGQDATFYRKLLDILILWKSLRKFIEQKGQMERSL